MNQETLGVYQVYRVYLNSAKTFNRPLRESLSSDKSIGNMGNVEC